MGFSWLRPVRFPSGQQRRESGQPCCTSGWSGFTLVELLVVIAVMAVLAGLLLPVMAQAREHARQAACFSRLHQIATAHRLYMDDWDDTFPRDFFSGPPPTGFPLVLWTEMLQPYLRSEDVWRDPSSSWTGPGLASTKLADYVLFTGELNNGKGTREEPYGRWTGPPLTTAQVVRPTETLTVMDGFTATRSGGADEGRHHGGMNVAFVDGHLGWLRSGALFRVDTTADGFYYYHYIAADR
jgi:prepilin-type N-terminal cleavage/methylation domain-containing protein/prepilin-type processing-associated H-X9-DG protein